MSHGRKRLIYYCLAPVWTCRPRTYRQHSRRFTRQAALRVPPQAPAIAGSCLLSAALRCYVLVKHCGNCKRHAACEDQAQQAERSRSAAHHWRCWMRCWLGAARLQVMLLAETRSASVLRRVCLRRVCRRSGPLSCLVQAKHLARRHPRTRLPHHAPQHANEAGYIGQSVLIEAHLRMHTRKMRYAQDSYVRKTHAARQPGDSTFSCG